MRACRQIAWMVVGAALILRPESLVLAQSPVDQSSLAEVARPADSMLMSVGIDQRLGEQVPLDLEFRDEEGQTVRLADLMQGRPVVLSLVYYQCPMLCGEVLNGLLKSSQAVPFVIGKDYDVLTVSFDPRETPQLAAHKKAAFVKRYRRPGAEQGWHFLVGDQTPIERLAASVGFRYQFDKASNQFAHGAGIVVLTPEGKVSRYFYGIDYPPTSLRLALVESAAHKIGSPVDQFLLLCFHYDPLTGRYGLAISRLLTWSGIATLLVLGTFLALMIRRERRMPRLMPLAPRPVGEDSFRSF
jgi:protein SCO1